MIIYIFTLRIIHHKFLPEQIVNRGYYLKVLKHLRENMCRKITNL